MEEKILILENEESTIQLISQVAAAMNVESLVMHNWSHKLQLYEKDLIRAIFVNVELGFLDLKILQKQFARPAGEEKVYLFFLYSKSFSRQYQAARRLEHDGELKKPLKPIELFELLQMSFDLEKRIEYPEEAYRQKLKGMQDHLAQVEGFIRKLEGYFE